MDLWGRLQHLNSAFVACDTPPSMYPVDLSFARILSYVRVHMCAHITLYVRTYVRDITL